MMAIAPASEPIGRLLAPQEYDALPENPRRELVDGVVHVMATPTPWHQDIKIALVNALRRLVPQWLRVTSEIEVRLGDLLRRNPDVLVVRADGFSRRVPSLRPDQVILAVEVVSPGSESIDRVAKPSQYAAAGIAHYWRIETDPRVIIYTYRLAAGSVGAGSAGAGSVGAGSAAAEGLASVGASYVHTGTFEVGVTVEASGLEWAAFNVRDLVDDE